MHDQLSNLRGLLLLSMLMTESTEESQILRLAETSVPSFGRCRTEGVYLIDGGWRPVSSSPSGHVRLPDVTKELDSLGRNGGPITALDRGELGVRTATRR